MSRKGGGRHLTSTGQYGSTHLLPMKGYQEFECFKVARNYPHFCFQICGLKCARICDRFGYAMCEGCPCEIGRLEEIEEGR